MASEAEQRLRRVLARRAQYGGVSGEQVENAMCWVEAKSWVAELLDEVDALRRQCWDVARIATDNLAEGKDWNDSDRGDCVVGLLVRAGFDVMQTVEDAPDDE